ncbi:MAG: DUF1080 domain-containing protein [Chlorobi bacterium]|nr:DUF1080 domain-containing protein [Chlorobiota bacterium]
MRCIFISIILLVFSCTTNTKTNQTLQIPGYKEKGPLIQLFNGKNLDNWVFKFTGEPLNVNYKNTFHVENGILKVSYDDYDKFNNKFGHLFYKKKFSNYKLRAEYRFVGEQPPGSPPWGYRNNGLMLHCQSPESMELNQYFPVSVEAQLLGGNGKDKRPTMGVCTPGTNIEINGKTITRHCTPSTAKTFHGDQWVTVEVVVLNNRKISHFVNGKQVLTYEHPTIGGGNKPDNYPVPDGTPLKEGYIAIQAESHPTEFRKIELIELEVE